MSVLIFFGLHHFSKLFYDGLEFFYLLEKHWIINILDCVQDDWSLHDFTHEVFSFYLIYDALFLIVDGHSFAREKLFILNNFVQSLYLLDRFI